MANMNIRPYFDDYDESKGYYRILFRPSYSLQARELTQLQTISQNQISRVGDTILKDGDSLDYGEIKYNDGIVSVSEGVFYINGFAAKVDSSTIGTTDSPIDNSRIGFLVVEEYIEASDDSSLYDNAQGTTNYRAPGADRYKLSLELQSRSIQNSPADLTSDFVEIFRVIDGVVYKSDSFLDSIVTEQKYNEREGENYITDNFDIELSSTDTDYTVKISDGATIIDGREVRIDTPVSATTSKPQDTQKDTFTVAGTMVGVEGGSYIEIPTSKFEDATTMNTYLYIPLQTGSIPISLIKGSGSQIGTGYITSIGQSQGQQIKVFISGLRMFPGENTSNVDSISTGTSTLFTNLGGFYLSGSGNSVFKLPEDYITNISSYSFSNIRKITEATYTSGQELVISEVENVVSRTGDFLVIQGGTVFSSAQYSVVSTNQFKLNLAGGNFSAGKVYVVYDISYNLLDSSHSLFANRIYLSDSKEFTTGLGLLLLEKPFVTNFKVLMAPDNSSNTYNIDITHRYILDDGQTDTHIYNSELKLRDGLSVPPSKVKVEFDYWSDTNTQGLIASVSSYQGDYDKIPTFVTDNGDVLNLADCIDFRTRITDASNNVNGKFTTGTFTGSVVSLFGKRTDVVSIDKQGSVSITKGNVYKDEETLPDSNGVELYKIVLSPYGKTQTYERIGNKKLSNVELLSIDNRLSKLENQLSISELEQDALISESGSLIHGVLTDPFLGHNVADTSHESYKVSIDYVENSLRPTYNKSFESVKDADGNPLDGQKSLETNESPISDVHNLRGYDVIKLTNGAPSTHYGYVGIGDYSQIQPTDSIEIFSDKDGYISTKKNSIWKDWEYSWYGSKIPTNSILDFQRKGDRSISDSYRARIEHDSNIPLSIKGNSGANPTITLDGVDINNNFSSVSDYVINIDNSLSGKKFLEIKSDNYYAANYIHGYGYLSDFEEWGPLQDSISQEFTVYVDSVYTKVDLYLSESIDLSSSKDVYVQIRKMKNGKPSNTVLGTKVLEESNYQPGKNVIEFDKKIPLSAGTYCITVYGSNSSFGLLCSTDYPNGIGNLFVNQTKVADKTLKFNLYKDSYTDYQKDVYYDISGISRTASIQSVVPTDSSLRNNAKIILDGHGYKVGDTVFFTCNNSEGRKVYKAPVGAIYPAGSTLENIVGRTVTLVDGAGVIDITSDLNDNKGVVLKQDGTSIWIASLLGTWPNASGALAFSNFNDTTADLWVEISGIEDDVSYHYNGYWSTELEISKSIVYADQSSFIIQDVGMSSEAGIIEDFATISSSKVSLDSIYLKSNQFVPDGTSIDWFLNGQAITPNTTNPLAISMKDDNYSLLARINGTLESSPLIDEGSLQATLISNAIDPVTVAPVHQRKDFYDVEDNSRSVYISKPFSLSSSASGLRVNFDALVPSGNHIMVYMQPDTHQSWTKLETPPLQRNGKYESLSYFINNLSFSSVRIKILFKGELSESVPQVKNLKIIAVSPSGVTAGVETSQQTGSDSIQTYNISEINNSTSFSISINTDNTGFIINENQMTSFDLLGSNEFDLLDSSGVDQNHTFIRDNCEFILISNGSPIDGIYFNSDGNGLFSVGDITSSSSTFMTWQLKYTHNNEVITSSEITSNVFVMALPVGVPLDSTDAWDVSINDRTDGNLADISAMVELKVSPDTNGPPLNQHVLKIVEYPSNLIDLYNGSTQLFTDSIVLADLNGVVQLVLTSNSSISLNTTATIKYIWEDAINNKESITYQQSFNVVAATVEAAPADSYLPVAINTQTQNGWGSHRSGHFDGSSLFTISGGPVPNQGHSPPDYTITLNGNLTNLHGETLELIDTSEGIFNIVKFNYSSDEMIKKDTLFNTSKNYEITVEDTANPAGGNVDATERTTTETVPIKFKHADLKIITESSSYLGDNNADKYMFDHTPELDLTDFTQQDVIFVVDKVIGGNGETYTFRRIDSDHLSSWKKEVFTDHIWVQGNTNSLKSLVDSSSPAVDLIDTGGDGWYKDHTLLKYDFNIDRTREWLKDWTWHKIYSSGVGDKWVFDCEPNANDQESTAITSKEVNVLFDRTYPVLETVHETIDEVKVQKGFTETNPFSERIISDATFGFDADSETGPDDANDTNIMFEGGGSGAGSLLEIDVDLTEFFKNVDGTFACKYNNIAFDDYSLGYNTALYDEVNTSYQSNQMVLLNSIEFAQPTSINGSFYTSDIAEVVDNNTPTEAFLGNIFRTTMKIKVYKAWLWDRILYGLYGTIPIEIGLNFIVSPPAGRSLGFDLYNSGTGVFADNSMKGSNNDEIKIKTSDTVGSYIPLYINLNIPSERQTAILNALTP